MKLICNQDQAQSMLMDGGVGVMATDTVYGLVARAEDKEAVAHLYELKKREHKPGTVIAANTGQLIALGLNEQHIRTIEHLWPNPLSLIIPASNVLAYLHQGLDSLAVRIPKDATLQAMLKHTGPLLTSSANQPGEQPAVNLEEAKAYFKGSVDFYVDSGDLSGRAPSTIIRVSHNGIEVIREGAVTIKELGYLAELNAASFK